MPPARGVQIYFTEITSVFHSPVRKEIAAPVLILAADLPVPPGPRGRSFEGFQLNENEKRGEIPGVARTTRGQDRMVRRWSAVEDRGPGLTARPETIPG